MIKSNPSISLGLYNPVVINTGVEYFLRYQINYAKLEIAKLILYAKTVFSPMGILYPFSEFCLNLIKMQIPFMTEFGHNRFA